MNALTTEAVIAEALARTDVPSADLKPFRTNLELLVDCINAEASLRPEAVAGVQHHLAQHLRNRIEVSYWAEQHPEIREEPIAAPTFLTGLPRSGTTYFQYILDSDPAMRFLRYWEGQRPCPPSGYEPATVPARIDRCAAQIAEAKGDPLGAKIAQIHLSDADGPEECLGILNQTFANVGHYWTYRVPTYFDRCLDTVDLREAYEYHKLVLQLLQWRNARKRWVLKWPCHLVALQPILDVYPDATFIVTHRDPVQALASNCSLSAMLRRNTSSQVDLHEIGQQMKRMILAYLEKLVEFDQSHGSRIAHVDYMVAVERPETAVAQAFEKLAIPITPEVTQSIVDWRRDNPPGKRGTHDYALEDYGLDAREVAAEYAFYIDRFGIPSERKAA